MYLKVIILLLSGLFLFNVSFVFATSLTGDANKDCSVDGLDYVVWLNNYGTTTDKGVEKGDFNTSPDGKVDGLDYVLWLNNYGKVCSVTPTASVSPTVTPTITVTPTTKPHSFLNIDPLPKKIILSAVNDWGETQYDTDADRLAIVTTALAIGRDKFKGNNAFSDKEWTQLNNVFTKKMVNRVLKKNSLDQQFLTGDLRTRHFYFHDLIALWLALKYDLYPFTAEERNIADLMARSAIVTSMYSISTGRSFAETYWQVWPNPNYQLPIVGSALVGYYILGPNKFNDYFANTPSGKYDHQQLLNDLKKAGLDDLYNILTNISVENVNQKVGITWGYRPPFGQALSARLTDKEGILYALAKQLFAHNVPSSPSIWGYLEGQPNPGKFGMLFEFQAEDGGDGRKACNNHQPGDRDDLEYAAHGFRDWVFLKLVAVANGDWQKSAKLKSLIPSEKVGGEDLFYKIDKGNYPSYANGNCKDPVGGETSSTFSRPLYEILK